MCLVNSFLGFRPSFLHFSKHASRLTLLTVLTSCSIRSIKTVSTTSQQRSTQTIRFRTYVSLKQVNALYRLQRSRTSSRTQARKAPPQTLRDETKKGREGDYTSHGTKNPLNLFLFRAKGSLKKFSIHNFFWNKEFRKTLLINKTEGLIFENINRVISDQNNMSW